MKCVNEKYTVKYTLTPKTRDNAHYDGIIINTTSIVNHLITGLHEYKLAG